MRYAPTSLLVAIAAIAVLHAQAPASAFEATTIIDRLERPTPD